MASFADFSREMRTLSFMPGQGGAEAVAIEMATFAKAELARVIRSGEGSPVYDLFVNGKEAADELAVEMPGSIVYLFSWWEEVIATALVELIKRSPRKSGRYASSFIVVVNGKQVALGAPIPADAEVAIVNAQPYTRKVEVGAMTMSVPPRHFDSSRRVLARRFGSDSGFKFRVNFLDLPAGIHPLIPYALKGQYAQQRRINLASLLSGGAGRKMPRRASLDAGKTISYPALVMRMDG